MPPRNILPVHNNETKARPNGNAKGNSHHGHNQPPKPSRLLPNGARNELLAFIAEFCGTFMFLFFAFGATQIANNSAEAAASNKKPSIQVTLLVALSFGFSLAINVWIFFRISGGLFNPAVTLALALIGAVKPVRAVLTFIAQMLGAMAAAGLVSCMLPGPLTVTTRLSEGTTIAQGVFLEMFFTILLVLTVYMLAAEKHKATFLAPVGIGLALFVAEMMGVIYTGGSLNPARSFGPDVVVGFAGYHWIYWVGPLMGTLVAFGFYRLVKDFDYETVNPGQDFDDREDEAFHPPEDPESPDDVRRPDPTEEFLRESLGTTLSGQGSRDGPRQGSRDGPRQGSRDGPRRGQQRGWDDIEMEEGRGGGARRSSADMRQVSSADRYRGSGIY